MTQHLTAEALRKDFLAVFGQEADQTFFSPGRINLIGEHTDYNGGHVFPAAISLGTYGAARKRDDQILRFYSANFEDKGIIEVPLADLKFEKEHNWTNYPKGVLHFLQEAGHVIDKGFDFYVYGNIPNGAGLSSSASLELLTGVVAEHLFDLKLERLDLVKIGKQTENNFIGVNSGIMDQFAIGMGAGVKYYYSFDEDPTEWMEFDVKLVSGKLKRIPTEESLNTDFYKILLMGDEEQLNEFETFIPEEWRDEFYVVRSQKYLVEVLTKGVNKAFGLEKLAQKLNIQPSEIAAIGDAANDIEMLEYAGLAIAMGNGSEEVKAIADIVTDTNENNGVIKAIDKLIQ